MTILSILIGTILEWYDFSLFASMSPVIAQLFFPTKSPMLSMLAALGVFASGFLMRPLGAVIFGYVGDRYGRRNALSITILLMALPTTLIGLLPTYAAAGISISVGLVFLRLIQGLASSGEYPGAVCFLVEIAPAHRRGFWGSLSMFGVVGGLLLGSVINAILSACLSHEAMYAWGWRIPFLLGLPLGIVGWFLRYKVAESSVFKSAMMIQASSTFPLKQLLKQSSIPLLKLTLIFSLSTISFYLSFVYVNSYLISVNKLTFHQGLIVNISSTLVLILLVPFFGFLSDKINRKSVMLCGVSGLFIFFYPFFHLFLSGNLYDLMIGQWLLAIFIAMMSGPMAAVSTEIFSTLTRYSGVAIALNIGASFFGGTCPLIAAWLVRHFENEAMPAFYPMFFAFVVFVVLLSWKMNSEVENTQMPSVSICET